MNNPFLKKKPSLAASGGSSAPGRKRRGKARALWFAGALMVLGLVIGLSEKSRAPEAAPGKTEDTKLAEEIPNAGEEAAPPSCAARKPALPATFRLGAGYAGGFFLGWLSRKFIKTALLVSGGLLGLLALAKGLGWFETDWALIEGYVRNSFAWVSGHAGSFKTFITGYLPSAGAATLGFIFGLWSD